MEHFGHLLGRCIKSGRRVAIAEGLADPNTPSNIMRVYREPLLRWLLDRKLFGVARKIGWPAQALLVGFEERFVESAQKVLCTGRILGASNAFEAGSLAGRHLPALVVMNARESPRSMLSACQVLDQHLPWTTRIAVLNPEDAREFRPLVRDAITQEVSIPLLLNRIRLALPPYKIDNDPQKRWIIPPREIPLHVGDDLYEM